MNLSQSARPWLYGIGGAAALGLVLRRIFAEPEERLHVPDRRGLVAADPEGLARAAGTSLAAYSLASAMQSEEHDDRGRLAVGRAVWNAAHRNESRIFGLLAPRGHFGSQEINPYAATTKPPTARTLALASAIIAGRVPDLVFGATRWDAPAAQDALHAREPGRYKSAAEVAARRLAEGYREVRPVGVERTRFWTRT